MAQAGQRQLLNGILSGAPDSAPVETFAATQAAGLLDCEAAAAVGGVHRLGDASTRPADAFEAQRDALAAANAKYYNGADTAARGHAGVTGRVSSGI